MHVTKIMIVGWSICVFISYRREVFSEKAETKKIGSVFCSFKTLPVNKLKQIYHILKNTFLSFPFMPLRVTSYPDPVM